VVKGALAIRESIHEKKQFYILDAWDVLRWKLNKVIGLVRADESCKRGE
jgi:hypothetical protein